MITKNIAYISLITLLLSNVCLAADNQKIRFYKANNKGQTDLIWFTNKKAKKPGCHNFLLKTRVYKAVQFGYQSCVLYSKKNCPAGSEIAVTHKDVDIPTTSLSEGYGWLPESKHRRGAKLRSWSCEEKKPT